MEKGSSVHMAGIEAHKQNNASNPEVAKNGLILSPQPIRPIPGFLA
jgi:hypothetical protein